MTQTTKDRVTYSATMKDEPAHGVRPEPQAYRIADACYALGISRTSLYALAKSGELKMITIAGRTLVPRSEIDRLTRVDREE